MEIVFIIVYLIGWLLYKWFTRLPELEGLILVFAPKGTGKSSFIAYLVNHIKIKKRYKAQYSDEPVRGAFEYDVDEDLGKRHIEDSIVYLDEAASSVENTKTIPKHQRVYIRLLRHYKSKPSKYNTIILFSQSHEDINIVARRTYDNVYKMERAPFLSFITGQHYSKLKKAYKTTDIDEETGQWIDKYYYAPAFFGTTYFNRKHYYRYFDSYSRPQLADKPNISWEFEEPLKLTLKEKAINRVVEELKGFTGKAKKFYFAKRNGKGVKIQQEDQTNDVDAV